MTPEMIRLAQQISDRNDRADARNEVVDVYADSTDALVLARLVLSAAAGVPERQARQLPCGNVLEHPEPGRPGAWTLCTLPPGHEGAHRDNTGRAWN